MKKKFKIEGLECANCGAKTQEALSKPDGVNPVNVSFLTEKVKFDLDDDVNIENLLAKASGISDKIEPGSKIIGK